MADQVFLSRFTPSRTDPEVLERIFVQRQALAKDAEERLRESAERQDGASGRKGLFRIQHCLLLLVRRRTFEAEICSTADFKGS